MNETERRVDASSLVGGALLIAIGILFLLDQLRIADFGWLIRTYWPVFVVAVGLPKLFDMRTVWSGLWLIAIGSWLQMVQLHAFGLTYRNSWPLVMIVAGAGIVLRTVIESVVHHPPSAEGEEQNGS